MATPIEFIKENKLDWQPSFNGKLSDGTDGYRGALIVEEGKQISPDRVLPPKIQARQVIMISDEKIKFFTCELESFNDFKPMFDKYGDLFTPESLNLLYVTDLNANGTFVYEGIKFTAIMLDESSVWNEILDLASLEKSDMKRFKKQDQKIEKVYNELLSTNVEESAKSYEEMLTLIGVSSKQLMGAV